ncbi:hypothetical protein CgunFtcFv8_005314 [Champsocephalus gunnari]|uniref:UPAR/Ly6 domain-containing protein n=1 Tax=Champsocephalus gunnari TaxID=52237 RepID=A0AAN8HD26_CHAGU|nr:hypothetical protein CgunFtcFv8_005314 [Champsocephalus gunnari]
MTKLIWVCAALMAMFVTGESLICHTCRMGFKGRCMYSSTENCTDSQPSCFSADIAFNISQFMSLHHQGCMPLSLCNKTESGTLLTAGYTITRACCSKDRCNGATSIHIPLTAALGTALMAIWSTWSL